MVKSRTCKLRVDCQGNGTYTTPDLVFTKTSTKEKQQSNVKMAIKIRRKSFLNKYKIAVNERSIKALQNINKVTVKRFSTLLRQQILLNAELSKKVQDLYGE